MKTGKILVRNSFVLQSCFYAFLLKLFSKRSVRIKIKILCSYDYIWLSSLIVLLYIFIQFLKFIKILLSLR
jgi:hypothetical protein